MEMPLVAPGMLTAFQLETASKQLAEGDLCRQMAAVTHQCCCSQPRWTVRGCLAGQVLVSQSREARFPASSPLSNQGCPTFPQHRSSLWFSSSWSTGPPCPAKAEKVPICVSLSWPSVWVSVAGRSNTQGCRPKGLGLWGSGCRLQRFRENPSGCKKYGCV